MAGDGGELLARPMLLCFPNRRLLHDLDDGRYPFCPLTMAEMDHGQQATERRLGWCLVMVRATSGEASAPRTCIEASSSSPLAS
jgi:hypothetical protein